MTPTLGHHNISRSKAVAPDAGAAAAAKHQKLVKQAQNLVGQTFFGTLLKQMRNSPFHSQLFEGGRGGEAFGALYDQQLAEHMARGAGHKLVNSIVKRLEARTVYRKAAGRPRPSLPRGRGSGGNWSSYVATALRA